MDLTRFILTFDDVASRITNLCYAFAGAIALVTAYAFLIKMPAHLHPIVAVCYLIFVWGYCIAGIGSILLAFNVHDPPRWIPLGIARIRFK